MAATMRQKQTRRDIKPLFKQLKTLGQVVEVSGANWQQDEDVFNNINS